MFANIARTRVACSFSAALLFPDTVKPRILGVWLQRDCETFVISQGFVTGLVFFISGFVFFGAMRTGTVRRLAGSAVVIVDS